MIIFLDNLTIICYNYLYGVIFMKKEKIELKERNNKDTIKTVPLSKLVKILDEWVKNHPKDMEILGR